MTMAGERKLGAKASATSTFCLSGSGSAWPPFELCSIRRADLASSASAGTACKSSVREMAKKSRTNTQARPTAPRSCRQQVEPLPCGDHRVHHTAELASATSSQSRLRSSSINWLRRRIGDPRARGARQWSPARLPADDTPPRSVFATRPSRLSSTTRASARLRGQAQFPLCRRWRYCLAQSPSNCLPCRPLPR